MISSSSAVRVNGKYWSRFGVVFAESLLPPPPQEIKTNDVSKTIRFIFIKDISQSIYPWEFIISNDVPSSTTMPWEQDNVESGNKLWTTSHNFMDRVNVYQE